MSRARRILLKALYWLAVLIVSLAVLVGLILLLESRDDSSVDEGDAGRERVPRYLAVSDVSRAKATMRWDAL